MASPNVGSSANQLMGVAAVSASDVWAVGNYVNSTNAVQTLIEQWNGTSWSVAASPNVSSITNGLRGVAAVSASDVWAVGYYVNSTNAAQTLIEQWNGTSWSVVASPNVGSSNNFLSDVAAVSASDVWAVGDYVNSTDNRQTLIEHWNGTSWSVVASPNVGTIDNGLSSVAALSPGDIWAAGNYFTSTSISQTLIEHWNGRSWSVVASPNAGTNDNFLSGVAAVSASNVWTVGNYYPSTGTTSQTLTEHWNGTSWSVVPSPNGGSSNNFLSGVAAVSAIAVGMRARGNSPAQTLTEHWNGTSWSVIPSPNGGSSNNSLFGVAAVSASDIWAVGDYENSTGIYQTLIEFIC